MILPDLMSDTYFFRNLVHFNTNTAHCHGTNSNLIVRQ